MQTESNLRDELNFASRMANTYFNEQQHSSRAHTFWVDTLSVSWGRANAMHMREAAEAKYEHERFHQEVLRLNHLGNIMHNDYETAQQAATYEEAEAKRLQANDIHNATLTGKLRGI